MVAILEVGAFISSLSVGRIGDMIGRRRTILYGSITFFIGGALQTFANGMPMMLVGRIVAGLGVGALSTIVPVYQSEISPPHNRGKLACIEFTGNVCGYAASVWVDYFCSFIDNDYSWRVPLALQCFMGALLGIGSLIICESPRYDVVAIIVLQELTAVGGYLTMTTTKRASSSLLTSMAGVIYMTTKRGRNIAKSKWGFSYNDKKAKGRTGICSENTPSGFSLPCLHKPSLS